MTENYLKLKIRLLFSSYFDSIFMSLLFISIYGEDYGFIYYIIPLLFVYDLIRQFKSKEKYLATLTVSNENAEFIYLTPNLKRHEEKIALNEVSGTEISQTGFLIKFPMQLNIKYQGKWKCFILLDKRTLKVANSFKISANTSSAPRIAK